MIPHIASLQDRFFYWASSLEIFKQRPILGFGPGSFGVQYARFKIPAAMETQHSHSIFFEILTEDGLLGVLTFLWFWVLLLQKSWKDATIHISTRRLKPAAMCRSQTLNDPFLIPTGSSST